MFLLGGLIVIITCAFCLWLRNRMSSTRQAYSLPPGPKRLPILGNLLDVPSKYKWHTYQQWSRKYGDVIYTEMLGQPVIVLDSLQAATDLLEKRAVKYSDRTTMPAFILSGLQWDFGFMQYGIQWRKHRRLFRQYYNQNQISRFELTQITEVHRLLQHLRETPGDFMHHIRNTFTTIVLTVTYGASVLRDSEIDLISLGEAMGDGFADTGVSGQFLVDFLPILRHIPAWMPGAGFQRKLSFYKKVSEKFTAHPFAMVKASLIHDATATSPSVAASILAKLISQSGVESISPEDEQVAMNIAAAAYAAGAETMVATIQTFFLAMTLHPEVQQRAQAELDTVVGPDRLPEFRDRESLVYINALITECLRWQPVAPLGIAHTCTEDDIYRGYLIPKGSIITPNVWAILHNPDEYPEPEVFKPERFMKDGKPNPSMKDQAKSAFGFGRRICPGRHFADASIFIAIASILHVYHLTPSSSEDHIREPKMTSGFVSFPKPFGCNIHVRSQNADRLIRREVKSD